jgi:hypothetical protein
MRPQQFAGQGVGVGKAQSRPTSGVTASSLGKGPLSRTGRRSLTRKMSFARSFRNGKCRLARQRPSSPSCSANASSELDGNPAPRTRFPARVPRFLKNELDRPPSVVDERVDFGCEPASGATAMHGLTWPSKDVGVSGKESACTGSSRSILSLASETSALREPSWSKRRQRIMRFGTLLMTSGPDYLWVLPWNLKQEVRADALCRRLGM